MSQRVLALEVDAHELKAAVVETTFRDYRVVGFHREPVVAADGSLAEQVRGFLQRHNVRPSTVLTSLPGDLVSVRTFYLPFRDRKRLDQTVPFELETQVPFGLDEVIVDYQVLHRDGAGSTVLAALVQRHDLEEHLKMLSDAGLDPKIVDLAPLATLNVLTLLATDLPPTFAYVGGNFWHTTVALYRNKQLVGLRTLVAALPASAADVTTAAAGNGHAREMIDATDLVRDIRWTLLALNGAPLDEAMPCFVIGDGLHFDALAQELAAALDVRVQRLDEAPLRSVPAALRSEVSSFISPLGLALREIEPNDSLGVNFRRGEFAYHRGQDELRQALWRSGSLAALVLALFVTSTYMDYEQLASRLGAVQKQIRYVFTQTFPDIQRVNDEKAQMQAEIDSAQKHLQLLGGLAPVNGAMAVDVLRIITAAIPDTVKVDTDEYVMDPDAVKVKSKTDTFEQVDTIKQLLLNTHYFGDVQVKDVKTAADGKVDFRLVLSLTGASPANAGAPPKP
jgi:general secretion pathway protein L